MLENVGRVPQSGDTRYYSFLSFSLDSLSDISRFFPLLFSPSPTRIRFFFFHISCYFLSYFYFTYTFFLLLPCFPIRIVFFLYLFFSFSFFPPLIFPSSRFLPPASSFCPPSEIGLGTGYGVDPRSPQGDNYL